MKKSFFTTIIFLWSAVFLSLQAQDCSAPAAPYVQWSGCNKTNADLSYTDLNNADLTGAILTGADLTDTDLTDANLTGVVSGGITGTPYALPTGWALVNGYLVGHFTVTFDANGGTTPSPETISVTTNATYGTLATASRPCYSFNGWFSASNGGYQITSESAVVLNSNRTLYAQWTAINYNYTEPIVACGSYEWHGTTFTSSNNTATWTGQNAAGCDSIVTLNLTIKSAPTATITGNTPFCAGGNTVLTANATGMAIAAEDRHSLFLKNDGTVRATGNNDYGQLGDGTNGTQHTPTLVSGLSGITTAIAAGKFHSLFLKNDGTVWATGRNEHGQLGDGTYVDKNIPVQVSGLSGITAIAAGESHSLFLKNDGSVWATGINNYGQLGNGAYYNSTPFQLSGLSGITAISAGVKYSLFLKNNGTVWATGINNYGQLGDGTYGQKNRPVQVSGLSGITAIEAGETHSLFLKNDGTVWATGRNTYGQLGDGTNLNKNIPVQVSELSGITAIAAGSYHSLFLKNGGTVWATGYNGAGLFGDGTNVTSNIPVQVSGLSGITAIAAGWAHSLFLKNNGTVRATGTNDYGQLGVGSFWGSYTPTPVSGFNVTTTSYQWKLNGSDIAGATNATYTATAAGNYTVVVSNSNGCSTSQSVTVVVNQPSYTTEPIVACGSYEWHGNTYTSSNNTATWTGTNAAGCNSIVTLNLTINQPSYSTEPIVACGSYEWHGNTYTSSNNTATWTGQNAAGCDSIVTLNLTIDALPTITCTDNIIVNNDHGLCGALVTFADAMASGSSTPAVTYTHASGSLFPVGTTTVIATTSNSCGVDSCSFTVTVNDVQSPSFVGPEQWASSVLEFSSEYTINSWGANQALGYPNVYPQHADIPLSWASANEDDGREFISLGYNTPMYVSVIDIYETYNPGAIDSISLRNASTGVWYQVWTGTAEPYSPINTSRIFTVTIPSTSYLVDAVRIALNSPAVPGWNEIDAVALKGSLIENITAVATQSCTAAISITEPTATDNCSINLVSGVRSDGLALNALYPSGVTTISWTASDIHGNVNNPLVQTITVTGGVASTATETIVACGSYDWHGTTFTSSNNTATWTGQNAAGCDSIVTLNLTITPFTVNTTTIEACDSYTWPVNGQTYTASGTHIVNAGETVFFNSLSGLTSAVSAAGYTLSATETFESYSSGPQGTLTGSFGQGSLSWTASSTANGSYTQPSGGSMALSTNSAGPLTISFNPGVTSVGANFFVTNGGFATVSGTITLTLSDGSSQSFYTTTANSFGGFVSHGAFISSITIATSNDFVTVDNLVVSTGTINACISEELNLTINHPSTSTEPIVACGSLDWHGTTYTSSNNTATWTGTNAAGCDSIVTLNLMIQNPSTAPTSISSSVAFATSGTNFTLSVNGGSLGTGATWKWYTGSCGGTLIGTGASISVSQTANTTYFVRAEGTCNTTACATITVNSQCGATGITSSAGTTAICAGSPVTLTVIGSLSPGAQWRWDDECDNDDDDHDCSYNSSSTFTVSPTSTKTYYVRSVGGACGLTACVPITVNVIAKPATPGTISGSASVCASTSVTYTIAAVAGATSYTWTAPSNATLVSAQGATSMTVSYASAFASGTLKVKASNCSGASSDRTLSVSKRAVPSTPGTISGASPVCAGSTQTYSISAVTNASNYTWTLPSGMSFAAGTTTNGTSVQVVLSNTFASGTISVKANNICGVSSSVRTKSITGKALPTQPSAISGATTLCNGSKLNVYSVSAASCSTFNWTVPTGATITTGQGTNSIKVTWGTTSGTVSVTMSNSCGVSAPSTKLVTSVACRLDEEVSEEPSIEEAATSTDLRVYPNPTAGNATVVFGSEVGGKYTINVLNTLGQVVYSKTASSTTGENKHAIDISELSSGLYFINLLEDSGMRSMRLVKK